MRLSSAILLSCCLFSSNTLSFAEDASQEEIQLLYQQLKSKLEQYDDSTAVESKSIPLQANIEKSYLTLTSTNKSFKYKFDGRIMLDMGKVNNSQDSNQLYPNTEFRRLRFAIKTTMYKHYSGEFDIDFAENQIDIKDMWVAYHGFNESDLKLKVGNFKPHFSIDELISSRWSTFMETAQVSDAFSPGRSIGLGLTNYNDNFFIGAGFFGDEPDVNNADEQTSEKYGYSARFVYHPFVSNKHHTALHFGFNYLNQKPGAGDSGNFSYSQRPEAHFIDYKFLDTGDIANTTDAITNGIELAAIWNKLTLQSEYLQSKVKTTNGNPDPEFDGWYISLSYFLSNDFRKYDSSDGELAAIIPANKNGAFEIATRYSNLNLNDFNAGITGGEANNISIAFNWYLNNNIAIKTNYIHVDNDEYANNNGALIGNDDLDILGVRLQYLF